MPIVDEGRQNHHLHHFGNLEGAKSTDLQLSPDDSEGGFFHSGRDIAEGRGPHRELGHS
jgi:hypothetical protein